MRMYLRASVFAAALLLPATGILVAANARNIHSAAATELIAPGPGIPLPPLPKNPKPTSLAIIEAAMEAAGPGIPLPPLPKNPKPTDLLTLGAGGPGIPLPPLPKNPKSTKYSMTTAEMAV